jgi:hypothetical protein
MQENFVKRIKRQPLVSSNGFKRTTYAAERSLFFSELQSIQRLDMSALYVMLLFLLYASLLYDVVVNVVNVTLVRSARSTTEILPDLSLISLSYIMERQQIKLSDNSVRSSLPAEPVLLSPRCLLLVVLASSVPFFVLVPLPVRNLRVVNSHLPRPPSVCLPSLLCVYRTGSSTRANRTGRKKQPNRCRRGTRLGRSIAPLVLGQGGAPFLPVARKSLVGTSLFPKWNDDSNSPEFLLPRYGRVKNEGDIVVAWY